MDIPWEDVRLFLAIAESGSLTAAARKLRLGQPTVSRRLAALEYALGAGLFRRAPDGVRITAAGTRLLEPARRMAEWAGEVGRAAEKRHEGPSGLVRVTAAPYVAAHVLAPFAALLQKRQPGLRLEVLSTMHYLDLARGEADLALRPIAPTQADLVAVHSQESANAVFATPALAAGLPKRARLTDLPWIAWAPPYENLPPNPQLAQLMPGYQPAFTSDNFLVNLAAAEAGVGAMVLPLLKLRAPHRALVPLRLDLGPFSRSVVHLVCARSALDIPRVRLVADLLVAELRALAGGAPSARLRSDAASR